MEQTFYTKNGICRVLHKISTIHNRHPNIKLITIMHTETDP